MTHAKRFFGRDDRMGWGFIYDRFPIREGKARWKPVIFALATMYIVTWTGNLAYRFVYDNPIWEARVCCPRVRLCNIYKYFATCNFIPNFAFIRTRMYRFGVSNIASRL